MSEETTWLPLSAAATRCAREVSPEALGDILKSGRVPLRGKRSVYGRADQIEHWLPVVGNVGFYPALSNITLYLDMQSRRHREIAAELYQPGPVSRPPPPAAFLDWIIEFTDVVVRWPTLAEELQAEGFKIKAQQQKRARRSPATASALPRPEVSNVELRKWLNARYTAHAAKNEPTSEAADWKAAQQKFGQRVRRERVRDLRRELAPSEWRKQGRRSKTVSRNAAENSAE